MGTLLRIEAIWREEIALHQIEPKPTFQVQFETGVGKAA
jgi:hypothetical protein